jgi:hypothetical protein
MHSGKVNPRELGRKSGESRRRPNAGRVPASLREELRTLDPAVVKVAVEEALAGSNQSAKIAAVKLLADVDAFSREGAAERDFRLEVAAEAKAYAESGRHEIEKLVVDAVVSIVLGEDLATRPAWVSTLAANLDGHVNARIAELKAECIALDAELAGVKLQRQEFSAT